MPPTHSLMVPRTIINALSFECIIYMNYTIKKTSLLKPNQPSRRWSLPPCLTSCSPPVGGSVPSQCVILEGSLSWLSCVCFSKGLCVQWSLVTGPPGGTPFLNILARKRLVWESCTEPLRWKNVISVSTFETMSSFLINNNRNVIAVTQQPDNVCKYCWITGRA